MPDRNGARSRLKSLDPNQRNAWLDFAEAEFRRHGFAAASLNRILAAAGLSKGQAYYYFADKAELYRAMIERALGEVIERLDARLPEPRSREAYWAEVAEIFGRLTRLLESDARLADLGRGVYREPAAQAAIADLMTPLHMQLRRLLEKGQDVGAVRTDLPLSLLGNVAFALAAEVDRWFALDTTVTKEADRIALADRATSLFVGLLAPPAAASAAAS